MNKKPNSLAPAIRQILFDIAEARVEELWDEYNCIAGHSGIWVQEADLPTVDSQNLLESGLIKGERRIKALEKDGSPNADEIMLYQDWWLKNQLKGECDYDTIASYVLAPINDGDGHHGVGLILSKGYSFSEINRSLADVFASNDEAIAWMKEEGWCT